MLKITAIGNLTHDVELKMNEATGKPYAILRIASDRRYKDKDGNKLTDLSPSRCAVLWRSAARRLRGRAVSWQPPAISRPSPSRTIPSASPVSSSKPAMWNSCLLARRRARHRRWRICPPVRTPPDENTGITYTSAERSPVILPEMAELLPPLSAEQSAALEEDLLRNGCYAPSSSMRTW